MICAKCGASNPSESAYCGGCGSPLAPEPAAPAAASTPGQETPFFSAPEASVASAGEDMPTFHTIQPAPAQSTPPRAVEDEPTLRASSAQPAPASSEFMNVAPSTPQSGSGANNPPVSPTPAQSQPSGSLPGMPQASGPLAGAPQMSGPLPAPAPAPLYPGAAYPQQGPVFAPGVAGSGYAYPQQGVAPTPAPGFPGAIPVSAFPGAVPVAGFSSAAPPNTPQPTPGALPPGAPWPGVPGGSSPMQGQVSGFYTASTNEMPAGAFPGPFPGQPVSGSWGAYAAPGGMPPAQPSEPSKLIRPLPLWAFIISIVVVAGVLAVLTFFTGSDWAAGASVAGVVALVVAVLILIAFGVRAGLGMLSQTNPHRRTQIISALLLTLLLIVVGFVGLTQQAGIHTAQAHALEGQQKWQQAINEYQLGGQGSPSSEDIARTYNGWGKALISTNQYADGIAKYETVISNYSQAPSGFTQAKKNAVEAYVAWAQSAEQDKKYDQATQHYDKLLAASYCDSACQSKYGDADANDYYKLAEGKLTQQPPDYAGAVAAFNQLTTRFGTSSYSKQAHADYAKALWGDGQQLLGTTCSSALTLYQQLSSQFSDTPEGQQATTALKQSVKVKGHFTSNIPSGNAVPFVSLVQDFSTNITSAQLTELLDKSPQTIVDSNGDFVFSSVKQGNYYLLWGVLNKTSGGGRVLLSHNYPALVGPLCAFDFGSINESFPNL